MKRVLAFWVELFNDLGCSVSERTVQSSKEQELVSFQTTGTGAQGVQIPSESVNHWLCSCGTVNKGNFCMKCGNKCETGTPLWICSCGNLNKGKFCSKCGSPRKE